jgi:hypothetical protein
MDKTNNKKWTPEYVAGHFGVNWESAGHISAALAADHEKVKALVEALQWLDEFVIEPEYFPANGDRQWWQEKRQAIRAKAKEANE